MKGNMIIISLFLVVVFISSGILSEIYLSMEENENEPDHLSLTCRAVCFVKVKEPEENLRYSELFLENDPSEIAVRILTAFGVNYRNVSFSRDGRNLSLISGIGKITINFKKSILEERISNNDFLSIKGSLLLPDLFLNETLALTTTRDILKKIGFGISNRDHFTVNDYGFPKGQSLTVTAYQTFKGCPLPDTGISFEYAKKYSKKDGKKYSGEVSINIKHRFSGIETIEKNYNETELIEAVLKLDQDTLKEIVGDLYDLDNFYFDGTLDYFPNRYHTMNKTLLSSVNLRYTLKDDSLMRPYPFDTRQLSIGIHIDPVTLEPVMISY